MLHRANSIELELDSFANTYRITFTGTGVHSIIPDFEEYKDCTEVDFSFEKHIDKRSKRANRLLWACIGDICTKTGEDKWSVYLGLLRDYGKWKHMDVTPEVAEYLCQTIRESEIVNVNEDDDGNTTVEMFCYYGSSTYNKAEFGRLVDGVMQEMRNLELSVPAPEEWEAALKYWRPSS